MTSDEFAAAGVYDPSAPDARERLNLLRLIRARGGSLEQIIGAHGDGDLERLARELLFLPEPERLSAAEVAVRAGVDVEDVYRVWRIAGLPSTSEAQFTPRDVDLVVTFEVATQFFGEGAATQLLRVIASAASRIADATISTFNATVGAASMAAAPDAGALEEANRSAAALLGDLNAVIDTLLRHHLAHAARPNLTGIGSSTYEHSERAVGFVDLVASTTMSRQLPLDDVAAAVERFESTCSDIVTALDGRIVKFVGDAAMFTMTTPADACTAALDIVEALSDDDVLIGSRAGLAYGDLILRDGDCFGPVVSLAARATAIARTGTVVVSDELRRALGNDVLAFEPLPPKALKGFGEPITLYRVRR